MLLRPPGGNVHFHTHDTIYKRKADEDHPSPTPKRRHVVAGFMLRCVLMIMRAVYLRRNKHHRTPKTHKLSFASHAKAAEWVTLKNRGCDRAILPSRAPIRLGFAAPTAITTGSNQSITYRRALGAATVQNEDATRAGATGATPTPFTNTRWLHNGTAPKTRANSPEIFGPPVTQQLGSSAQNAITTDNRRLVMCKKARGVLTAPGSAIRVAANGATTTPLTNTP